MKGKTIILFGLGVSVGFVSGNAFLASKVVKSEKMRKALSDIIADKVAKFLYGDSCPKHEYSWVSYRDYYKTARRSKNPDICAPEEMVFSSKSDAEKTLDDLNKIINTYGFVTMADFYDICGITDAVYADTKYGWTNLANAYVLQCNDGYTVKLGEALPIK